MIDIIVITEKFIDPLNDWVCLWLACPRRSDSGKWREMGGEEIKNVREGEEEKERTRSFSPHPPRCAVTTIWTPAKRQQQLLKFVSSSFLSLFFCLFFYSSAEPVCTEIVLLHAENFRPCSLAKPDDFRAGTKSDPAVAWTATAQNWKKSFTHMEHRSEAVGREGLVLLIPMLTSEYLPPSQWVPVLAPNYFPLRSEYQFTLVWHRTYPICDAPTSRSAWHSFALLQKSRQRNHRCCVWTEALSGMVSRFCRVGWFSRALAFRLLYYPWGKMGTTCSLSVNIALAHTSAQFWLCQKVNIL